MATTWIRRVKYNSDKKSSMSKTFKALLDYIMDKSKTCVNDIMGYISNPNKTHGEYVSSYGCVPELAAEMFENSIKKYHDTTGKDINDGVLLYQMRQSFKPGEITPEKANELGQELVRKFTKNAYAFIVCTHVDKAHIHNHIAFNAVSLDGTRKFHNPFNSSKIIRRISDQICAESGLSVIENPKKKGMKYHEWLQTQDVNLVIDVQNSIKAQNSPGYEHWAKLFSIKQMANTLLFLEKNNLTSLDKLDTVVDESKSEHSTTMNEIEAIDVRLDQIKTLQSHIGAYGKTKEIYKQYRSSKSPKKFYAENEADIEKHLSARKYFDTLNVKSLPKMTELKQEFASLKAEKGKLWKAHHERKEKMREALFVQKNVEMILGATKQNDNMSQSRKHDKSEQR